MDFSHHINFYTLPFCSYTGLSVNAFHRFFPKVIDSEHDPSRWRSLFSGVKLDMRPAFACAEVIERDH